MAAADFCTITACIAAGRAVLVDDVAANFFDTQRSAAFTVGVEPVGFAVMCLSCLDSLGLDYAVSVRRLAHLHSGFLQTNPRG